MISWDRNVCVACRRGDPPGAARRAMRGHRSSARNEAGARRHTTQKGRGLLRRGFVEGLARSTRYALRPSPAHAAKSPRRRRFCPRRSCSNPRQHQRARPPVDDLRPDTDEPQAEEQQRIAQPISRSGHRKTGEISDPPCARCFRPGASVVHQSTENSMIGRFTAPTIARMAQARAERVRPRWRCRARCIRDRAGSSSRKDVSRPSHTHHAPHIGLPHQGAR